MPFSAGGHKLLIQPNLECAVRTPWLCTAQNTARAIGSGLLASKAAQVKATEFFGVCVQIYVPLYVNKLLDEPSAYTRLVFVRCTNISQKNMLLKTS